MTLELFGIQLNLWGIYCAIGALCAFAAVIVMCAYCGMKKGSAPVLGFTSLVLGIVFSRLLYCLFTALTVGMPFTSWLQVAEGGWSMLGMIGGVMLAAWISAKITSEKPKKMLDAVSAALPLMIAAERIGEESLQSLFNETRDVFNLSRKVASEGFLTIVNDGKTYMATYRIDAFLAMVLFLVLAFSLLRKKRRDGDLWILFMLLCGAGGVLTESLRKDQFMEYSFVRIQQVLFAVMLAAGVAAAGYRSRKRMKASYIAALVTMALTIAEFIGLEFIIDRSEAIHSTMYGVMIGGLSVPAIQGITLMRISREGNETACETGLTAANAAALAISATEVIAILLEMGRVHYSDKFMLLATLSAAAILVIQCVMISTVSGKKIHTDIEND